MSFPLDHGTAILILLLMMLLVMVFAVFSIGYKLDVLNQKLHDMYKRDGVALDRLKQLDDTLVSRFPALPRDRDL